MSAWASLHPRTKMRVGVGSAPTALRAVGSERVLIIADALAPVEILGAEPDVRVQAERVDETAVTALAETIRRTRASTVVVIGGGTVLDAAKIASIAAVSERLFHHVLGNARHSALTVVPRGEAAAGVVAIPTTPGTSSETNAVAVLKNSEGYRLIVGDQLRPRVAILDGAALMTLPTALIREGCLEALLRLAGAHTSAPASSRARSDAIRIGQALIRSGDGRLDSPEQRLHVSRLSAATQRSAALRVQDRFAARHWYVANEVAFALGVRKVVATAPLVTAIWSRILDGDSRWGDRRSLRSYWSALSLAEESRQSPAEGIGALIDRWGIERAACPQPGATQRISEAVIRAWADRVGALRGVGTPDVHGVLSEAGWGRTTPSRPLAASTRPRSNREEVNQHGEIFDRRLAAVRSA